MFYTAVIGVAHGLPLSEVTKLRTGLAGIFGVALAEPLASAQPSPWT
jgi:hypothetical protein